MALNSNEKSEKSRLITFLLAFFFGFFGVDRFYSGKIVSGIFKLLTLGGICVWWIIDWIMILSGNYKDKWGKFITNWEADRKQLIIVSSIIGFCLLLTIVGLAGDNKTTSTSADLASSNTTASTKKDKKVETIKVNAIQIYNEYKENEVSADKKYKGKLIDVSGEVDKIGKDIMDNPYVSLVTLKNSIMNLSMVQCSFNSDKSNELALLKKGTKVIIRGEGKGSMATIVEIGNCELLK